MGWVVAFVVALLSLSPGVALGQTAESVEVIVRLERVDGLISGSFFSPTLTTALPARLTLGTDRSTSTSRIRINTYARVTNPERGVANPAVDRAGGKRIANVSGGIALSGDDYTASQIDGMAVAVCAPGGGLRTGFCESLVSHPRLPAFGGALLQPDTGLADGMAGLFQDTPSPGIDGPPGVRCVTFQGAAANECEALLYGFDLEGLLELGDSYAGLLRLVPRATPGQAFTIDGAPPSTILPFGVELCASTGCLSRVAFSEAALTVGEGDGEALVTLAMDPPPAVAGTVTIAVTEGTNADSGDYTIAPAALTQTVATGVTEVVLTVGIVDDTEVEGGTQTLTLGISGASGGVGLGTQSSAVLEITDNDFNDVSISFGAASYSGVEGGAVATVTLTLDGGPQRQVTVPIVPTSRGGATDADYSGLPSAVTLAADQVEATFEVTVVDDPDQDPGEELELGFGTLPGNILAGVPATATVALTDNDSDWVAIEVNDSSGNPATVLESGTDVVATVTAAVSLGLPAASAGEVEVTLSLPPGDIEAVGTLGTVTISLGAGDSTGSTTRVITVRALADSVVETPEAVPLGGTASGGPPGIVVVPGAIIARDLVQQDIDDSNPLAGSATASDIDTATVSIGNAVAAMAEGATVTLRATLDQAVNVDVSVLWLADTNSGDVVNATGTVIFPALGTQQDVVVTIADDNLNESAETVEITLGTPQSAAGDRVVASSDAGTVAILASDGISVTFAGSDWVSRGRSVVYTVALVGGVSADEAVTVTVGHAGVGGLMTAAAYGDTGDYVVGDPAAATQSIDNTLANAGDNAVVVIPANGTEGRVTVYALAGTAAAGERLFEIFASAVGSLGSGNVSLAANPTVTTTISGDAALTVGFGSASYSVAEGAAVDVTVTLDRAADRLLEIEVLMNQFSPETVASLTFNPGSREASFPVVAEEHGSRIFAVEVRFFWLGPLPRGVSESAIPTARVTVVHDEAAINLLTFGPGGSRVAETAGTTLVGIAALTEPVVFAEVDVDLAISEDSTADASDYDLASLPTMDITQGRSSFGSFRLDLTDDEVVEGDETVVVGGNGSYYDYVWDRQVSLGDLLTINAATVTIVDDDTATVSVRGPATAVAEPGAGGSASVVFTVMLDGMADQDVTVTLATEDGGATAGEDFAGRAGGYTVVFAAGSSGPETFTVDLSEDDLEEGDEAFGVTVAAVTPDYGGAISFLGAAASATIQDEDLAAAGLTVGLSLTGSHTTRVAEQDSTVPLRLTAHLGRSDGVGSVSPLEDDLEVTLTVSAVGADAGDYYGLVLPTVTITAGETASTPIDLRFDLRDNEIVEEDESIVIGGDTGTDLAFNPMTVVITDEDKAAVLVGVPAGAAIEPADGESASVVFSVALGKTADKDVTVTLATENGTATADDDFIGRSDTVVFTAGATGPLPFTVGLVADDEFEGDEIFGVTVVAIEPDYGGAISFPGFAASATITDPAVSLTVARALGTGNELTVSWEPPDIPVTDVPGPPGDVDPPLAYEIQYKKSDEEVWTPVPHTGSETTAMIPGLEDGAVYDVRIRVASAGTLGSWAMAQVRTPAVNLQVLPRALGAGDALTGDDALLLFYFAAFRNVLADPMNEDVLQIIAGSLARGVSFDEERLRQLRTKALVLVDGALDRHAANLYKGTEENPSPFDRDDALLMFYALRFGNILVHEENEDVLRIIVGSLLPDATELSVGDMRNIIQAGIDLNREG